jgi:Ca2+-binding EF-hand superfamily protein
MSSLKVGEYRIKNRHNFSDSEILELSGHFKLRDLLGDGWISYEDLKTACKRFGLSVADRTLSDAALVVDPNTVGLFDFQMYLDIADSLRSLHMTETEVIEAFKIFDRDGTGRVDAIEFMRIMTSIGDKMSKTEAELMIRDLADKTDGKVHYEKIAKAAMSSL